jgi:hypothetical protein
MKKVTFGLTIMVSFAIFVLAITLPASARSIRCGTEIVSVGDPTIELLQKCGEPDLKELIKTNGLIIEKWTYNCGSARFMKILKGEKYTELSPQIMALDRPAASDFPYVYQAHLARIFHKIYGLILPDCCSFQSSRKPRQKRARICPFLCFIWVLWHIAWLSQVA